MSVIITKNMSTVKRLSEIKKAPHNFQAKKALIGRLRSYTELPKDELGIETHNIKAYADSE